jgi:hypothetical protein
MSLNDPSGSRAFLAKGRCNVAKCWGRKTYIALNRSAIGEPAELKSTSIDPLVDSGSKIGR